MSIETDLKSIAASLELIAHHLVGTEQPSSPDTKTPSSASGTTKKPKKSSGTSKEATPSSSGSDLSVEDVRAKLKLVSKSADAAAARDVLKSYGTQVLKDLDPEQFAAVIADCDKLLEKLG